MTKKAQKSNSVEKKASPMVAQLVEMGQPETVAAAINSFLTDAFGPTVDGVELDSIIGQAHTVAKLHIQSDEVQNDLDCTLDNDVRGESASYVVSRFFDQICRDLYIGMNFAAKSIENKQRQVAGALARATRNPGDIETERSIANQIRWLAQFKCQQEVRSELLTFARAMYRAQTGLEWVEPDLNQTEAKTNTDDVTAAFLS